MGFPILVRWHLYIESAPWVCFITTDELLKWIFMIFCCCWCKQYIDSMVKFVLEIRRRLLIKDAEMSSIWWRHQMEAFSALLAICAGNSPVIGEFPAQRPMTRSFDVFFDLRLNERLSKHWWGWWFETPSRPLWRHSNDMPQIAKKNIKPLFAFIQMDDDGHSCRHSDV